MKDKFIRIMLLIIALLLLANLLSRDMSRFLSPAAAALENLEFGGNSSALTCSSDGRYVYASDGYVIFRSMSYGAEGTWEKVLN